MDFGPRTEPDPERRGGLALREPDGDVRDGMRIDWDVPITLDDGLVVRADVYRPLADGQVPGHP